MCSNAFVSRIVTILVRTVLICALTVGAAHAQTRVRLLLTSNIQGKSFTKLENQESVDPLLVLAQNIQAEKAAGVDLYLDMGNAFYPGLLSKYSSGAIMMDFFDAMGCSATLVSSKDMHIGLDNLSFLEKRGQVRLLSANIVRPEGPAFDPYFVAEIGSTQVAFVGLSSKALGFDIAEKSLYNASIQDEGGALDPVLKEIQAKGVRHIVLLSGLTLGDTIKMMELYPAIDLALCGGDYTGALYAGKAARVDLVDGRTIAMLDDRFDYFSVDLLLDYKVSFQALSPRKALPLPTATSAYREWLQRLTLWKRKYLAEQSQTLARIGDKPFVLDDIRLNQLLRDRFNCELAVVDKNTINALPISSDVRKSDFLRMVNLDYNIYTFALRGDQLKTVNDAGGDLVITGFSAGKALGVQGYPLEPQRRYRVAATQSAFEKIQRLLGTELKYTNSWSTVTDLLESDLENDRILLRADYTYLERRFRTLVDFYLSNFVTSVDVDRDPNVETPVDQPSKSYDKWGLEDRIDLTFYNEKHRFVLTPYIYYVSQDDDYLQNLLRGTILYEYNLDEYWRPYNKFQADTVVRSVDGLRPVLIRETAGISYARSYFESKLGAGFDKKVHDPAEDADYGLEFILNINYPFLKYFTYEFNFDNFASLENDDGGRWGLRSEVDNAISAKVNEYLSFSLRYKYFYFFDDDIDEEYQSSQLLTTLNVTTQWKIW